jgi:hypothetical protein
MLTHYLDLALLPDPEFAVPQLMDALFAKLHRQLVLMQSDSVAVAFPQYLSQGAKQDLGTVLRLLGPEPVLNSLRGLDWLQGMRAHVQLEHSGAVPAARRPCGWSGCKPRAAWSACGGERCGGMACQSRRRSSDCLTTLASNFGCRV